MSKKNNANKKTTKKPQAKTKKPVIGIVIAAVAVLIAAAVAVAVYLIKNNDKTDPPSTAPIQTVPSDGSKYTYAQYKGTKMPVEFVEILNKAEQDSYDAAQKYGVALEIGEREISVPEFVMYYYDVYYFQTESVTYSIQQTGANRTGYDLEKLPTDQKHPRNEYMWSEHFTQEVVDNIGLNYMMFDEAVENGVELSNSEISDLMDAIQFIEDSAERNRKTPDEEISGAYCEGLSAAMYNAREIVVAYATKYDEIKLSEIKESFSKDEVSAELEKSNNKYKVAKLRIYPIEGDYVEAEANAVKTEKDLLEYANKNHPRDTYDASFSTDCGYITKSRVSDVYGDEVAEWAFAEERKAGDISVVQGMLFRYVVYVDTTAFYTTSCDIIFVGTQYDESMSVEEREKIFKAEEEKYLEWKNEDGTEEGFLEYAMNFNSVGVETIRLGDYHFQLDKWIFDPARKSGDHAVIDTTGGCGAVYYVEKNTDDYDWEESLRSEMATAELKDYQVELLKDDYEVKRNNSALNKAYAAANISIEKHQKRLKERENQN